MISDAELKEAAAAVNQAMLDALPKPEECTHVFSPAFERKMRKLIRRVRHPLVYKSLQRAACLLIVFVLSAGLFLAFHTEARAAVVDWVREKVEDFYRYFAPDDGTEEDELQSAVPSDYCLGWLPEGYTLLVSDIHNTSRFDAYVNEAGELLQFYSVHSASSGTLQIGGGDYEEKYIDTGKLEAEIYLSKNHERGNAIVWSVNNGDILLYVSAHLEEADLIKIAENIYLNSTGDE